VSAENVEIVRRMCEAFARGDAEAASEPLHPEVRWDASTHYPWPDSDVFHGREGVLEFFRRFLGTWDEYHAEFEDFLDAGDDVVVTLTERGKGKGSGIEVTRRFAQVWTVRDGKVVATGTKGVVARVQASKGVGMERGKLQIRPAATSPVRRLRRYMRQSAVSPARSGRDRR
jgi:ketosteroid isomerase-like protein